MKKQKAESACYRQLCKNYYKEQLNELVVLK